MALTGGARDFLPFDYAALRQRFRGTYIANNGYTLELAQEAVASGCADLIAFGNAEIGTVPLEGRAIACAIVAHCRPGADDPRRLTRRRRLRNACRI